MVNKVILIGRAGKDPEIRYTQDNTMIVSLSLATDESYKDKSGEKMQKTEWHKIVAFGKLAEIIGNYVQKGKLLYFEGRLQTRSWDDKGVKRYSTEIVASNMKMLERKEAVAQDEDIPF